MNKMNTPCVTFKCNLRKISRIMTSQSSTLSNAELERLAIKEILQEVEKNRKLDASFWAGGSSVSQRTRPNKQFLGRTISGAIQHNNRQRLLEKRKSNNKLEEFNRKILKDGDSRKSKSHKMRIKTRRKSNSHSPRKSSSRKIIELDNSRLCCRKLRKKSVEDDDGPT